MELMAIGYPDATSGDGYGANGNTILSSPNPLKVCVGNLNKIASDYLRADHSSLDVEDGMSGGALTILDSNHNYELLGITSRTGIVMIFFDYAYFCRVDMAYIPYYQGVLLLEQRCQLPRGAAPQAAISFNFSIARDGSIVWNII